MSTDEERKLPEQQQQTKESNGTHKNDDDHDHDDDNDDDIQEDDDCFRSFIDLFFRRAEVSLVLDETTATAATAEENIQTRRYGAETELEAWRTHRHATGRRPEDGDSEADRDERCRSVSAADLRDRATPHRLRQHRQQGRRR